MPGDERLFRVWHGWWILWVHIDGATNACNSSEEDCVQMRCKEVDREDACEQNGHTGGIPFQNVICVAHYYCYQKATKTVQRDWTPHERVVAIPETLGCHFVALRDLHRDGRKQDAQKAQLQIAQPYWRLCGCTQHSNMIFRNASGKRIFASVCGCEGNSDMQLWIIILRQLMFLPLYNSTHFH